MSRFFNILDIVVIILRTKIGIYASPFYPLLPAYRGGIYCVDATVARDRFWVSFLLSIVVLVSAWISVFYAGSDGYYFYLAIILLIVNYTRSKLTPVCNLRTMEIVDASTFDIRLSFDFFLTMVSIGAAGMAAAQIIDDRSELIAGLFFTVNAIIGVLPVVNKCRVSMYN